MDSFVSEEAEWMKSMESIANELRSQSEEALAEWKPFEQVQNETPSTAQSYSDTDDAGDDDAGIFYYTLKAVMMSAIIALCFFVSQIVTNSFQVLFCWSHFTQFTMSVVNKDPKKSKYSDTLHRFWMKEFDWGWKQFVELSKVSDGFIDGNTLTLKTQVQVIRERADRPFRCLNRQYRRELVRVYLTNAEQISQRFVEERRSKLRKLIEDKARWSSFRDFWLGTDQNARRHMSREKTDAVLKVVVKHFFKEKEAVSTLVMDSLYSELKALEGHTKCKKGKAKLLDSEEMSAPIVHIEKDTFVLVDDADVLLPLERTAMEPLPAKDDKAPQNHTTE